MKKYLLIRCITVGVLVFYVNIAGAAQTTTLTLEEVLNITLSNAQTITSALATVSSAKAQQLGALAAFMPSLSLSDQDQYYKPLQGSTQAVIAGTLVPVNQPIYNNAVSANVGLNLFNGGKDTANYQGSLYTMQSATTGLNAALCSTFEQVLGNYEALAADQLTVAAQQRIVQINEDIESLTSLRMTQKASSNIDLIQSQQQTLAARTQLSQNRQQILSDREQLERTMGYLATSEDWEVEEGLPKAPVVESGQYPVQDDPAVQSAYAQVMAARQQVTVASAAYWPTLSLTGQYNFLGISPGSFSQAFRNTLGSNYTVGVSASLPLLPFFNTVSAVDTAQATVETNLGTYQSALAMASSRAQSVYKQLHEAQQGNELAIKSAQLAQLNIHLTDARYQAHQSSRIDLDRAMILAEQAKLSASITNLALKLAAWKLYRAAYPVQFADKLRQAALRNGAQ